MEITKNEICSFNPRTYKEGDGEGGDAQVADGQANFGWKYMFSQLVSTIKVNLVAKIMQSTY